jgi:multisubunit Na+/H+ antiporter MnhG subunit
MSQQATDCIKVLGVALCITGVEIYALHKGKNGTLLRLVIIALAGLAGFSLAELIK